MSSRCGDPAGPAGRRSAAGLIALATFTVAAGADIPRNKRVIDIDVVPGKLGSVHFLHAAHAAVGWKADRSPMDCTDCHHAFEADGPPSQVREMRCSGCHPGVGEPDRTIGGRRARAMARLKPDGAIDYRSILFHDYCRDCHKKVQEADLKLSHCRACHPRGLGPDVSHGRYDSVRLAGAEVAWLRCPAGRRWNGRRCDGEATLTGLQGAAQACPEGCRLPSRAEFLAILEGCGPDVAAGREGSCRPCRESRPCAELLGPDEGTYWMASSVGDPAWTMRLSDGSIRAAPPAAAALVRCVQEVP
jgi:hypothetical protein